MSHWSSQNTTNRARLARAVAAHTGVGYQKCLTVVSSLVDAALLPPFTTESADEVVRAVSPLVLLQAPRKAGKARRGHPARGGAVKGKAKPSWGGKSSIVALSDDVEDTLAAFTPHSLSEKNLPPVVAITGAPGSGKSYHGFMLVRDMVRSGVQTVCIDPRADALPLTRISGMKSKIVHLSRREAGLLNPFTMAEDPREAALWGLETIRLLTGARMTTEKQSALVAVLTAVAAEQNPSLGRVVDVLLAGAHGKDGRALGIELDIIRKLPHASLCFAEGTGTPVDLSDGLTVVTMLDFDLPTADLSPDDYSMSNSLSVATMYLLAQHVRRILPSQHRTAVVVDEAGLVTSTSAGAGLISAFARTGRSTLTASVWITQDAVHLGQSRVRGVISTVFAFRQDNTYRVDSSLSLLGLDAHEGHRGALRYLNNGECLWRTPDGQVVRTYIETLSDEEAFEAFTGNPVRSEPHAAGRG